MKLYSLAPVALAAVVCAYWLSAEDDLERLERELAEERLLRRAAAMTAEDRSHSAEGWKDSAHRAYEALNELSALLGEAAWNPGVINAAQWSELRAHADALLDGKPWGPPPHIVERVEPPPGLERMLAAAQSLADYQDLFVPGGPRLDDLIDELTAAREAMGEPPTRREGSSPPVSPVATAVAPSPLHGARDAALVRLLAASRRVVHPVAGAATVLQRKTIWREFHAAVAAVEDVCVAGMAPEPCPIQHAAVAKLVENVRALLRAHDGHGQTYTCLAFVRKAIQELDDLRITPPGEVADPPTPVMPFGWLDLTSEQRAEVQAHVDDLRSMAARNVGSVKMWNGLTTGSECGNLDPHVPSDDGSRCERCGDSAALETVAAERPTTTPEPVKLGDTAEEIAEADAIAAMVVPPDRMSSVQWAGVLQRLLGSRVTTYGAGPRPIVSGSHLRGILRYLDEARDTIAAKAGDLDREQGRGSWAWQPKAPAWPHPHDRNPACPEHGVVTPDSFGGSDFEPYVPARCSCPPPKCPEPAKKLATEAITPDDVRQLREIADGERFAANRCDVDRWRASGLIKKTGLQLTRAGWAAIGDPI